jgi:hypothetical protein
MMCSVHRYKYNQDSRRTKLRRLMRIGILKLNHKTKTHFVYDIIDMEEYKKRK